jgi:hypothetical protein
MFDCVVFAAPVAAVTTEARAFHEAGHAVAAIALGYPVKYATVETNFTEQLGGEVRMRHDWADAVDSVETTSQIVAVLLAGPYTQARATGRAQLSILQAEGWDDYAWAKSMITRSLKKVGRQSIRKCGSPPVTLLRN